MTSHFSVYVIKDQIAILKIRKVVVSDRISQAYEMKLYEYFNKQLRTKEKIGMKNKFYSFDNIL